MNRFTEKDWNEYSAGVCEEKGREAPGGDKYRGKSNSHSGYSTADIQLPRP
jgi:hypothetical protein